MNNQKTLRDAFEPAARIYCTKIGVDPDEGVQVPHPLGIAVAFHVPRWTMEAERLIDLSVMLTSLKEAGNAQPKVIVQ